MILANIDKCVGCRSCEVACAEYHAKRRGVLNEEEIFTSRRMHVGIAMGGTKPMPVQCRHCENPACLFACISGATYRDPKTGMVLVDYDKCVGCWTCLKMCSYFAIIPDLKNHKILKCDKCMEEEMPPACVKACPNDVLHIEQVDHIDEEKCIGCGLCESLCLRGAIKIVETEKGRKAQVEGSLCKGCGICAASCPRDAIIMYYYTDDKAKGDIRELLEVEV